VTASSSGVISFSLIDNLANRLGGKINLIITAQSNPKDPIIRQIKFILSVNGTTLTARPPYSTNPIYITNVMQVIIKNIPLLKKPEKTLNSLAPSFLELI
jgi:hypothetical protein